MNQQYHGRCVVCEAPLFRSQRFCYVHDCYEGASDELVRGAVTRYQLERAREQQSEERERSLVRQQPAEKGSAGFDSEERFASLVDSINELRTAAGLLPLRLPE
jgi:hypothetical protein